jgi:hypothetical protein
MEPRNDLLTSPLHLTTSLRPSLRSDRWSQSSEQAVTFAGIHTFVVELPG